MLACVSLVYMTERFTADGRSSIPDSSPDSSEQDAHWSAKLRAARLPQDDHQSMIGLTPDGRVVIRLNLTGGKIVDVPIGSKSATAKSQDGLG